MSNVVANLLDSCRELEKFMTDCGYFGGKEPQYIMAMKARAAIKAADSVKENCVWTQVCEDYFDTECKKYFEFSDGGVADNGFEFCPYCGGAITIQNEGDS